MSGFLKIKKMVSKKGIAIDIDEVLSMTALSWMDIMLKKFGNPENLSADEFYEKYKLTKNVPYWQGSSEVDFLEKMRINNEFYENIPAIKDSVVILNKINKIIPVSCYLTTRPEVIRAGTEKWLTKNNFPVAEIIMRPENISSKDGNKWKAGVLQSLYPEVIGIIDDNPELIDFLPETYEGTIFLYGFRKFEDCKAKVIPCKDWENILIEIENFKIKCLRV